MLPCLGSAPAPSVRVLLIEDGVHLRYALRQVLESDGEWTVVGEAGNGALGRQLADDLRPDVIVMDNQMPIQTGLEALPELRRLCPNAVIVMWTSSRGLASRAQQLGADSLVDKARPLEDLIEELKDALRDAA